MRDRNGNCFSQVGGQDTCPPIREGSGSSVPHSSSPSPREPALIAWATIRAMTDVDPECTVLSIDGVGAYDHVLQLHRVPSPQGLLPFVRSTHARTTPYMWEDDAGRSGKRRRREDAKYCQPCAIHQARCRCHAPCASQTNPSHTHWECPPMSACMACHMPSCR